MTASWKYLAGFVLMSTLALAQVTPDAAQALEKMRQAHGGQALANLRTYREVATLTTFSGPQAEHTLTVVSYADFSSQRLRVEYRDGAKLLQVLQVSPAGGRAGACYRAARPSSLPSPKNCATAFTRPGTACVLVDAGVKWHGLKAGARLAM